jgi:uncharacterized membrane protein
VSGWIAVLAASLVSYGLKLAGYLVPAHRLRRPATARVTALLPAALLAALVAVQAFSTGQRLVLDARAAGLGVAAIALLLRAPFLIVVVAAAVAAALIRHAGWG